MLIILFFNSINMQQFAYIRFEKNDLNPSDVMDWQKVFVSYKGLKCIKSGIDNPEQFPQFR